jgi:23S rRNA pseudouridine1911/1915/1917 synthase
VVEEDEGRIDLPIGAGGGSRVFVRRYAGQGQPSRTDWSVERRLADRTLLRVFPKTGRRHQIRVHLAAIGHPVLGDLLYGRGDAGYLELVRTGNDVRRAEGGAQRQMLHCARLVLAQLTVEAEPPADFLAAMR